MSEVEYILYSAGRACQKAIRAWIDMVEQQPLLLGTLFALVLPIWMVVGSGTLFWAAWYHIGASSGLVEPRWYGTDLLYWLRALLICGFLSLPLLHFFKTKYPSYSQF